MNKGKIGVQMYTVKDKVADLGAYEIIRRIAELGYRAVEVSQIPMRSKNVAELKRASIDFDIKIAALSAGLEPIVPGDPGETLSSDFDKIVNDCKILDCNYLRIGMMPIHLMDDRDKIMGFIERAEAMANRLAEQEIELYYHTHHLEFQKFDGVYLLDIIKDNTTKLGFELDVHWIQRAGENPVEFVKKYKDRISLLHLKDYRIGKLDLSNVDFESWANFDDAFMSTIQFAEVGEGNLNIPAIIDAGLEAGAQYFLVEQDEQYGRDPFDCLKISAGNLRKMGYADWF
ncbi:sugar phosphate isomerase/epimerase family protein [Neobacillus drentensis]|uniref:sugar phosphate isomerase/epimerase family protein n=1 Tax=Neobacillus drentensis TaxID=220684 RepID=UPI0008264519|nr:sugar phosphate isomerase/epimerase [Neobacillus drentensis]